MTYNEAHSGTVPIYVTVCPGLYLSVIQTSPSRCPSTAHRSPRIWADATLHLWKNGGNPCSPLSSHSRGEGGAEIWDLRGGFHLQREHFQFPWSARTRGRGNSHWDQGRDQRAAFALGEPWGSPALGDLTPAHSHSWQSKAAWPGAESVYFFFVVAKLVSSNRIRRFGFFSDFSIDNFSVCLSHMDHDFFSLELNSSDTKYIGQDLQVVYIRITP